MGSLIISVYTTMPDPESAGALSHQLISEKLAACANIFPVYSIYEWKSEIQSENETAVLFKTRAELWDRICSRIESLHPYDVPALVRYDVNASDAYTRWVLDNTSENPVHS